MYYPNSPYCIDNTSETNSMKYNKCSKNELLLEIQQACFAAYDLQLYLDTHPDCAEALDLFTKLNATISSLKFDYENLYGPLKASSSPNETPFKWADENYEWPWAKCKEA